MYSTQNDQYDDYFLEALNIFDLERIYLDLIEANECLEKLKSIDKCFLRGALLYYDSQKIAKTIFWEVNSVRSERSSGINTYLRALLGLPRIKSHEIPARLSKYKHPAQFQLQDGGIHPNLETLELVSSQPIYITHRDIINIVLAAFSDVYSLTKSKLTLEDALADEACGDEFSVQKEYMKAIEIYANILRKEPLLYFRCIIKIILAYQNIKRFADSVPLSIFFIKIQTLFNGLESNSDDNSKVLAVIGGAYQHICLEQNDLSYFDLSLDAYRKSIQRIPGPNCVSSFNIIELIAKFAIIRGEVSNYIDALDKSVVEFERLIQLEGSNYVEYRGTIMEEAHKLKAFCIESLPVFAKIDKLIVILEKNVGNDHNQS